MTIALVQSAVFHGLTGGAGLVVNYPGATAAGNLLTFHGDAHLTAASALSSVTDSASQVWQFSASAGVNQNPPVAQNGGDFSFCAWLLNAGSVTSASLTLPNMDFATMAIAEWSGAGSEDTGAAAAGTAGAGLSESITVALSGAGELVLLGSNVDSQWTGFPSQMTDFPGGGGLPIGYALGQSGSQTYTWTGATASTDKTTVAVAAFLPPAVPALAPAGGRSMMKRSLMLADL